MTDCLTEMPEKAGIKFSDMNRALGNMISFNLPNNRFAAVLHENRNCLCSQGTKRGGCDSCDDQAHCKKIKICGGATPICERDCYGNNAMVPNVKKRFWHNYLATQAPDFTADMVKQIEKLLEGRTEFLNFRIHSIGDFYSYEYFLSWLEIAKHFEQEKIRFVAYTKRFDILDRYVKECDGRLPGENFRLLLSVMPDTRYHYETMTPGQVEAMISRLCNACHSQLYVTCYDLQFKDYLVDYPYYKDLEHRTVKGCVLHQGGTCDRCMICYTDKKINIILEPLRKRSKACVGEDQQETVYVKAAKDIQSLYEDGYKREASGLSEELIRNFRIDRKQVEPYWEICKTVLKYIKKESKEQYHEYLAVMDAKMDALLGDDAEKQEISRIERYRKALKKMGEG